MKRRVLRAHNNKKVLRHLQAVHGLREPHTVLCDSSFLRSVAQHKCENLFSLVAEVVGQCVVQVLPETISALKRQASPSSQPTTTSSTSTPVPAAGKSAASGAVKKTAVQVSQQSAQTACTLASRFVVASPFRATQQQGQAKNERKAIAEYVTTPSLNHNSFVFVATQSHDLRHDLPSNSGVLRATFQPLAVWLEEANGNNSTTSLKPIGQQHKAAAAVVKKKTKYVSTPALTPTPVAPTISPADAAFMKQLGVELPNNAKKKRLRDKVTRPIKRGDGGAIAHPTSSKKAFSDAPKRRKKGVKGVNPLSMKRKQVKESFVVKP